MRHLVVGTAGHIDHGKSALVRALTGVDPDRLKEEKRRGITIELGFADMPLDDERVISFVDVPGHERFIRHMVAGVAGIDAVVLAVAADQGVQPQTAEHLDICSLLRVSRGVVALTKCDLVDEELREVVELEIRERIAGTFLDSAPILPVSVKSGSGLEALRDALATLAREMPVRDAAGPARLPVDRAFVLRGFGTVVTGTVVSGGFAEGDEVQVLPAGHRARIRGLQVHHAKVERAAAGQRAAINLQGLDVDQVLRGSTVTHPGRLLCVRHAHGRVMLLPGAPDELRKGGRARFHQGTSERGVRVRTVGVDPEGSLRVDLRFDAPAVLAPGDRFVLRLPAPVDTVGGGEILDVAPPRRRRTGQTMFEVDEPVPLVFLLARLRRAGRAGRPPGELAPELGWLPGELERVGAAGEERGALVRAGAHWFDGEVWHSIGEQALEVLAAFHDAEPLRSGLSREELRARVDRRIPQDAWRLLLDRLAAEGSLRLLGENVAVAGHEAVLEGGDREIADAIERRFREAGLEPPDPDEAASSDPARARKILGLLIERGVLVRIQDGKLFHREAIDDLVGRLREYARESATIDVAAFKSLAGVTRKHAIPLLEHLDATRITRRKGNLREILA